MPLLTGQMGPFFLSDVLGHGNPFLFTRWPRNDGALPLARKRSNIPAKTQDGDPPDDRFRHSCKVGSVGRASRAVVMLRLAICRSDAHDHRPARPIVRSTTHMVIGVEDAPPSDRHAPRLLGNPGSSTQQPPSVASPHWPPRRDSAPGDQTVAARAEPPGHRATPVSTGGLSTGTDNHENKLPSAVVLLGTAGPTLNLRGTGMKGDVRLQFSPGQR